MNSVENRALANPFASAATESQLMRTTALASPPAGTSEGGGSTPSLGTIFQAFRRRWLLAVSLGLVAAALGVAGGMVMFPGQYTASGVVQLVKPQSPILGHDFNSQEDPSVVKVTMSYRIKSSMVIMAALKDPDLASLRNHPNPVRWLETALKTDFTYGPELMKVTLSGEDPQQIALIINRVMEAFVDESRQEEQKRHRRNINALEANLQKLEKDQRDTKKILADEEKTLKVFDLTTVITKFNLATAEVNGIHGNIRAGRIEVSLAEGDLQMAIDKEKDVDKAEVPERFLLEELQKTPEGKELLEKKGKIKGDWDRAKEGSQERATLQRELNRIDAQLKSLQRDNAGPVQKQYQDYLRDLNKKDREAAQNNLRRAKTRLKAFEEDLQKAVEEEARWNPRLIRVPPSVEALRDEVARKEAVLTKLGETIALLKAEPPPEGRVKEWSRAEAPGSKDYNRQIKFSAAGGFGMFLLAVAAVCFLELRAGRVSAAHEVQNGLAMPVVGTLPPVPARARSLTDSKESSLWQSRLIEAVDSVRSFIIHAGRTDNVHAVMVTSAGIGEGKTSLASQLAASLARAWKKTLLIDGDLRHPATHTLFKVPQEPGFAEVLRGEADLAEAIKPTSLSRLWLLPAGHCDAHAVQALAQDSVRSMIEALKQQYDFIIIDSCPILPVADSLSLGQHVDGVLYAVLTDVSRIPAMKLAQARLANLNVRSLGAVLIGAAGEVGNAGARYGMLEGSPK